ncbi:hypothetical protein ACWC9X_12465 [Streptomyces asoensis]
MPPTPDPLSLTPDFNGGEEGAERMKTTLREATELANPVRIEDLDLGGDDLRHVADPDEACLLVLEQAVTLYERLAAVSLVRCRQVSRLDDGANVGLADLDVAGLLDGEDHTRATAT